MCLGVKHAPTSGGVFSWAWKATRIGTKPKTQQGKQIIRNANLTLIQNWKYKNTRQKYSLC